MNTLALFIVACMQIVAQRGKKVPVPVPVPVHVAVVMPWLAPSSEPTGKSTREAMHGLCHGNS